MVGEHGGDPRVGVDDIHAAFRDLQVRLEVLDESFRDLPEALLRVRGDGEIKDEVNGGAGRDGARERDDGRLRLNT